MTDLEILKLIEKRDETGLRLLEEKYLDKCLGEAVKITGDERRAREAFYDALISLWNAGPRAAELAGIRNSGAEAAVNDLSDSEAIVEYFYRSVRGEATKQAETVDREHFRGEAKPAEPEQEPGPEHKPETPEQALESKKRINKKSLIILTSCLAAAAVVLTVLIIVGSRLRKEIDPAKTDDTGNHTVDDNSEPFEGGLAIIQPYALMPETIEKNYLKQMANSSITDLDEIMTITNEASNAVNYIIKSRCGDSLVLDNYDLNEKYDKTAFRFRTEMYLPIYHSGGPIMVEVTVEYRGAASLVTTPDGKSLMLQCIPDELKLVPFGSMKEFLTENPYLNNYNRLNGKDIDQVNNDIMEYLDEQQLFMKETSSALEYITCVVFIYTGEKKNLNIYRLVTKTGEFFQDMNYRYAWNGKLSEFYVYSYDAYDKKPLTEQPSIWHEGYYDENYFIDVPSVSGTSVICSFVDSCLSKIELYSGSVGGDARSEKSRIATVTYAGHEGDSGNAVCIRNASYGERAAIRTFNDDGDFLLLEQYENGEKVYGEEFEIVNKSGAYNDSFYSGLSVLKHFERDPSGDVSEYVYRCSGNNRNALVLDRYYYYSGATGERTCKYFDAAGREIASFPVTYNGQTWAISSRKEWDDPGLYFGSFYNSVTNDVRKIIGRDIWQNYGYVISADAQMITVTEDGSFSLYLVVAVSLPAPVSSSSVRSMNVQVLITGTAVKDDSYERPVWKLYPENAEFTGLYGTSYDILYELYLSERAAVFQDQAGKDLAGAANYGEFCDLMVGYLTEVVRVKDFGSHGGQWLYVYGFNSEFAPVSTYLSVDPPEDDPPIFIIDED